jgi:hypothetical protein
MPQQVVGPAARLAKGVRVLPPKEERLHNEVLDGVLTRFDPGADPLVARVEAAGVCHHPDQPSALLDGDDGLSIKVCLPTSNAAMD